METEFTEVLREAASHCWPHPLVVIRDEIVMAGHVDAYRLAAFVQHELQE